MAKVRENKFSKKRRPYDKVRTLKSLIYRYKSKLFSVKI